MKWIWIVAFALAPMVVSAQESSSDQYQVTPFPKTNGEFGSSALIVNQKSGDVWIYRDVVGSSSQTSGSFIRYEGKLVAGIEPGQVVATQGFGQKPSQWLPR